MTNTTMVWWALLCAVSAFNVVAWSTSAMLALRRSLDHGPATRQAMRLQILLSAGYVLGCAYRSAFPVYDVGRLVLVDSWLSSVVVGRSVATVAELCFAAQWALLMHGIAHANEHRLGLRVPNATPHNRMIVTQYYPYHQNPPVLSLALCSRAQTE